MTLTFAMNNALTGLKASSQQAEIIANNVSNALTEGYARRDVALTAAGAGGVGAGVKIAAVVRSAAPATTEARRVAEAASGAAAIRADTMSRLAAVVGEPGEAGALATVATKFEAALAAAADTPESAINLNNAVATAGEYVSSVNRIAVEAMTLRTEADASIANQVATINDSLNAIQTINAEIKALSLSGGDTSALLDQRERLIRQVSSMIPVKAIKRPNEEVAIYTQNGGQLLDGKVFPLEFTGRGVVTPDMTVENGGLSGLRSNGLDIDVGRGDGRGLFDGGSLSAAFELRDSILPGVTDTLDGLAADLAQRTQDLPEDATQAAGAAGLFTDAGAAFDPAATLGLSQRLSLNAAVDPVRGGDVGRLRDGLGATAPGDAGDQTVLVGLINALSEPIAPPAGAALVGSKGAADFAGQFSASVLSRADELEDAAAFQAGSAEQLRQAEIAEVGVDTDQQMTQLIAVEQAFSANARVISVVDELLQRLIQL